MSREPTDEDNVDCCKSKVTAHGPQRHSENQPSDRSWSHSWLLRFNRTTLSDDIKVLHGLDSSSNPFIFSA